MLQPSLIAGVACKPSNVPRRGHLDTPSERLLDVYSEARSSAGVSATAIATERSHLRSLVHASAFLGGPDTLTALLCAPEQLARVLVAPPTPISRSSGLGRLRAVQKCLQLLGPSHRWDILTTLSAINVQLPRHPVHNWHSTGLHVAGAFVRQRAPTPTLEQDDLIRLICAAGMGKSAIKATRDTAIVALLCFTGLRAQDLPTLLWEDVFPAVLPDGQVGLVMRCTRRDSSAQLPVLGPARERATCLGGRLQGTWSPDSSCVLCTCRGLCSTHVSIHTPYGRSGVSAGWFAPPRHERSARCLRLLAAPERLHRASNCGTLGYRSGANR